MRIIKGPLPPSVFYPTFRTADDTSSQTKVKRKCGRPRNPIPRHKRESHINAEHRRRGKIQDGFRTLKGLVPKYEQSSGRDSKADILFKAVDYCKVLQNDIKELGSSIEALKVEKDALSVDIKNYKTVVPDLSLYNELSVSLDDRYTDYVQCKSKENWTFATFKVIMRPLFESYKLCVRGESWGDFLRSVADWATTSLSLSNLRTVCLTTLRDVPTGFADVDQFKDGHNISSYGAIASTAKPIISDSNNNSRCVDSQSLAINLFECEHTPTNSARAGWNRPVGDEIHNDTFENTQVTTNRSSPRSKRGSYLNMQHSEDVDSFAGGHLDSSNVFGDLYYNLGNDLHHHQLNLARATMNNWPNLHFRQQHGHYYQNSHLFPSRNGSDFRDGHHFWGSQHQQLSQHLVGEHNLAPGHYPQQTYPLPDSDFRYNVSNPGEGLDTLPATVPYLGHSTHFHHPDHSRRKRLSQSSSESEGSLLNMEMFARKAAETMGENEKYAQLSPSTDSCVSSGSSAYIASPGVLNGRSADYVCSYRSASSLDNFKHRTVVQDKLDTFDSQLSLSLCTYRDIFGVRAAEQHTNYANRLDEQQKTCVNRHDGDVRQAFCGNPSSTVSVAGCRQPSSARHDSSLLAEILGQQQSALLQTWSANHCVDTIPTAPTHHAQPILHTLPVASSNPRKTADFVNGLVKNESAYVLTSLSPEQSPNHLYANAKDQHSSLSEEGQSSHSQTNQTPKNILTLDVKNSGLSNSGWLYPYAKSQSTPDFTASTKLKLERNQHLTGSPILAGFFDMDNQKLLKNHCNSLNSSKDIQVQLPDLVPSHRESCLIHKQETDIYNCKMSHVSNSHTSSSALAETRTFLEKSSQPIHQSRACSSFMETSLRQKIGRKSPFENGYPEDGQVDDVSASKRTCQRQESVKTSPRLMTRQYGDSETVSGL